MKLKPKDYAQGLYQAVKDQPEAEIKRMISNFVQLLAKKQALKLEKEIINSFIKIYNQDKGILEVDLKSARPLSSEQEEQIKNKISEITKMPKIELKKQVDQKILGGLIFKYQDNLYDASLKTNLNNLKNNIKK